MKIDTTAAPKTGRIAGTLHRRENAHTAQLQNKSLPPEKSEESKVAGRRRNNGQEGHKGAR